MAPLSELLNQARPARRPAVYGRRRGVQAETREMHRQLFGTDENDLEKRLDKLTINAEPEWKPPAPAPVCGPSPPKPELEVATHRPESQKLSTNKPAPRHNRPRKNADTPVAPSSLQSDPEAKIALVPSESKKTPSNGASSKQKLAPTSQQPTIQSKSRYVLAAIPVSTDRVLRRQQKQPVRGKQKREMAPIKHRERELLQPLLSSKYVKSEVKSLPEYFRDLQSACTFQKLGEGAYSDAYLFTNSSNQDQCVIKMIPFELGNSRSVRGGSNDGQESNCDVHGLLREIKLLDALTPLHGFARARGKHTVVRGKYPNGLVEEYQKFKVNYPEQAQNDCPSEDDDTPFYGMIEMYHAGKDLDLIKHASCFDAFDFFWMATVFLARAERAFNFEHRDLHMSNFCFTEPTTAGRPFSSDPAAVLGRSGRNITIIDYTLSRIQLEDGTVWDPRGVGGGSIEKPSKYDEGASQQMAVWRARRWCHEENARRIAAGEPPGNAWERYLPKTNVIWLGHMLGELRRRGVEVKEAATAAEKELQKEIWGLLEAVEAVLVAEDLDTLPESAEVLLERGFEEGWIAKGDVEAFKVHLNREIE